MGPSFRLVVEAEGARGQVLRHLVVIVGHDSDLYRVDPACFKLPCLVPVSGRLLGAAVAPPDCLPARTRERAGRRGSQSGHSTRRAGPSRFGWRSRSGGGAHGRAALTAPRALTDCLLAVRCP